jgi:hypothetical protein
VNKHVLRNVLRWGGVGIAIIGYIVGRTAHTIKMFNTGRFLIWFGLVMIVGGIFVRLLMPEKKL